MAKKLSFNDLPAAVEKILEILSSEGSEHSALSELPERITQLERKIEYLQIITSPDKPVMDMQTVCRVLKLKPKAVYELARQGVLPTREQGKKTVFYEEGVIKFYATQPAWKAALAAAKPESASANPESNEQEPIDIPTEGRQRVDTNVAAVMLNRSVGAVYQLVSTNKIPFHKDGRSTYFYTDELREWAKDHPPLKRKK